MRAADAAAQLIELRQAEGVGAVHEHRVRVRNVEPGFDDHRRDEDVDLAVHELAHHFLELALAHLPVADADFRARDEAPDVIGDGANRLDAVVNEENLAAAIQLTRDSFVDEAVVPRLDVGEHGRAVARRRLHQSHVAQSGQREVQRSRNRRCSESQYVGVQSKSFEALLVFDTEAMLLVNDDQPELREGDVGAQQAVRADDDVDLLLLEAGDDRRLLLRGLKPAHRLHVHRKIGEPLAECSRVLIGENRRRHEHDHLPPDCTALKAARTAISVFP